METERQIVEYLSRTTYDDVPSTALKVVKEQMLAVLGTTIAGASAEGCRMVVESAWELGGKEEASILIHGGKVPAQQAAFVNGVMGRALDFCDALAPGAHIGSAIVPAALAAAELAGGCSGKAFLAALAMGTELAVRLNLGESEYDGFDPTGVCAVFASTAAAAKILSLSENETWNALALAFNKCGGSFQANIDGSLAVRIIEGWVAETGITCARLAKKGITGPANFLDGVYGYFHLFGRDRLSPEAVLAGLGKEYKVTELVFKKYPSCGLTQGSTDLILSLMNEKNFSTDDVEGVEITVPPYTYKLVGQPFQIGNNPKVNAQFSIRYCVANALFRKSSKLSHFEEEAIRNPLILKLAEKVNVISDVEMEKRGHTPLDMRVIMKDGKEYLEKIDFVPGFPEKPLSRREHEERFRDCVAFAAKPTGDDKVRKIIDGVDHLEAMDDVKNVISLLEAQ
jgi:2-methylcitrate dehydratase PrpD